MKDILIIFCILLLVLLVISTLGGSVRPAKEAFVANEAVPKFADAQQYFEAIKAANKKEQFTFDTMEVTQEVPALDQPYDLGNNTDVLLGQENFVERSETVAGYDNAETFASF